MEIDAEFYFICYQLTADSILKYRINFKNGLLLILR